MSDNYIIHFDDEKTDEIKHYGVLGMKWGIRNIKETYSNSKNAKGLKNKLSERYGSGYQRTSFKNLKNRYQEKAGKSRIKLLKRRNELLAYNNEQAEKMWDTINKTTVGSKDSIKNKTKKVLKTIADTKVKHLSGRTSTIGEDMVDQILTGGVYGLYQDYKYLKDQKKSKKEG